MLFTQTSQSQEIRGKVNKNQQNVTCKKCNIIFFSSHEYTKLPQYCIIWKKCKISFVKEFKPHCFQFYKMRVKTVLCREKTIF